MNLSIIIPAYQEAAMIAQSLQALAKFLDSRDYGEVEVVVVVADSPDGTAKLAQAQAKLFKHFRLVEPGVRVGKGRDVRLGMLEAKGRYRVFMDADLATPLGHLDEMMRQIDHGAQVGIAERDLMLIHPDFKRKFISTAGNWLTQVVLLPGLKDTQCGFKYFSAEATEKIFRRMTILGWGFDFEILALARRFGYRIYTIPAPDWKDPKEAMDGMVGDSAGAAAIKTLQDLFTVRMNLFRHRYDKVTYTD